ncbi:MAG: L-aspartate oxidase [Actinomycetota bacterium]
MERIATDVLIVGAGGAGLFASLHLPEELEVIVVDKGHRGQGSSPWAQGGVAAALGAEDSPELHAQDTMRVAAGHADASAVAVLCSEAPECVMELVELGCDFDRRGAGSAGPQDKRGAGSPGPQEQTGAGSAGPRDKRGPGSGSAGELHLAREGGQSVARSAHSGDATGAAIMRTLRQRAAARVRRVEGACVQLAVSEGRCAGGWVLTRDGLLEIQASSTVLATGGLGALYDSTTNPPGATGDGMALGWDVGAGLSDVEFVQFHPTALALGDGGQRLLLTEALRGAGAYVVDAEGRRFLFEHHCDGELAPRDVVARAIAARHSWLDCRHLDTEILHQEFPTVVTGCRAFGLDPAKDLLPVVPAAHYSVGGIQTDLDGRSSIPRLYAIGECASTGVHGANRLAGNSLAEALVFGRRAARAIAGQRTSKIKSLPEPPVLQAVKVDAGAAWPRLKDVSSSCLGIERTAEGLGRAQDELEEFARLPLIEDRSLLELRFGARAARLVARAASLRRESRGVHHRADLPDPDPAWAGVRLRLTRN